MYPLHVSGGGRHGFAEEYKESIPQRLFHLYRLLAVGVVMTCCGRVHKCIVVIERKCFSHHPARMQAATLTWLAYYDFTSVYVANMQTLLKSLLAFVHSDVKHAFSQSPQYICVHQHGDCNTDVSGKLPEIYGAASSL